MMAGGDRRTMMICSFATFYIFFICPHLLAQIRSLLVNDDDDDDASQGSSCGEGRDCELFWLWV